MPFYGPNISMKNKALKNNTLDVPIGYKPAGLTGRGAKKKTAPKPNCANLKRFLYCMKSMKVINT